MCSFKWLTLQPIWNPQSLPFRYTPSTSPNPPWTANLFTSPQPRQVKRVFLGAAMSGLGRQALEDDKCPREAYEACLKALLSLIATPKTREGLLSRESPWEWPLWSFALQAWLKLNVLLPPGRGRLGKPWVNRPKEFCFKERPKSRAKSSCRTGLWFIYKVYTAKKTTTSISW